MGVFTRLGLSFIKTGVFKKYRRLEYLTAKTFQFPVFVCDQSSGGVLEVDFILSVLSTDGFSVEEGFIDDVHLEMDIQKDEDSIFSPWVRVTRIPHHKLARGGDKVHQYQPNSALYDLKKQHCTL